MGGGGGGCGVAGGWCVAGPPPPPPISAVCCQSRSLCGTTAFTLSLCACHCLWCMCQADHSAIILELMRSAQVADGGAAKPRRTVAVHNALAAMEYVRQGKHADAQLLLLPLVVSATFRVPMRFVDYD